MFDFSERETLVLLRQKREEVVYRKEEEELQRIKEEVQWENSRLCKTDDQQEAFQRFVIFNFNVCDSTGLISLTVLTVPACPIGLNGLTGSTSLTGLTSPTGLTFPTGSTGLIGFWLLVPCETGSCVYDLHLD